VDHSGPTDQSVDELGSVSIDEGKGRRRFGRVEAKYVTDGVDKSREVEAEDFVGLKSTREPYSVKELASTMNDQEVKGKEGGTYGVQNGEVVVQRGSGSEVRDRHNVSPVDFLDLNKTAKDRNRLGIETLRSSDGDLDIDRLPFSNLDVVVRKVQLGGSVNERHQQVRLSALVREGKAGLGWDVRKSIGRGVFAVVGDGDVEGVDGVESVVERDFSGRNDGLVVNGCKRVDETSSLLGDGVER
jgi:hypothetical protein